MTTLRTDLPDLARSTLRVAVRNVEDDLLHLSRRASSEENGRTLEKLVTSWGGLVKLLALGPEPLYRTCPSCGHIGMREATLCGCCWTKLAPLGSGVGRENPLPLNVRECQ